MLSMGSLLLSSLLMFVFYGLNFIEFYISIFWNERLFTFSNIILLFSIYRYNVIKSWIVLENWKCIVGTENFTCTIKILMFCTVIFAVFLEKKKKTPNVLEFNLLSNICSKKILQKT